MTASKRGGRSEHNHLSEEDRVLWAHVVESVTPARPKGRASNLDQAFAPVPATATSSTTSSGPSGKEPRVAAATVSRTPMPAKPPPPSAPLAPFERRHARRIAKGHFEIHARIDLHGLRQSEAHAALRAFLFGCFARGNRTVLVITGKGGPQPAGGWADADGQRDRGVLRRNVPRWLAEPDLRDIIVSYTSAAARHGGDGALYVQLRVGARIKSRG